MVTRTLGLLLLLTSGLTLCAQAQGDFAPRGSLLYVRCDDVSGALRKLGGPDWVRQAEDLLRLVPDNMDPQAGGIDEAKRFIDFLGETELVIADVMVRAPHVQLIEVTRLKDGAPTAFSESFVEDIKRRSDRELTCTPTELRTPDLCIRIVKGLYITTIGGAAETHVRDVLEGDTENSLSGSERFKRWNKSARGEVVAWADMAAVRNTVEKMGEDFHRGVKQLLDFAEWQKWDQLSAALSLSNGVQLQATLTMTEPLKRLGAFMRPSGPCRLPALMPEELLGFAALQLGADHEATLLEVLRVVHDVEETSRPASLERQISWCERRIAQIPEEIKRVAKDPDLTDEDRKSWIESLNEQLENEKDDLARLKAELAAADKARPFEADPSLRKGEGSEAERFSDGFDEFLKTLGVTRRDAAGALGTEGIVGVLHLQDPARGRYDRSMESAWFVAVEATGNFDEVKNRMLDRLLGRNLPDDLPEEERRRLKQSAERMVHYRAHGGEILTDSRGYDDWAMFAGHGMVGFAASEYVAHRVLEAANGTRRMDTRRVTGGLSASKLGWLDLKALFEGLQNDELAYARRNMYPTDWLFDFALGLPAGAAVSVQLDEAATAISARASLSGVRDLAKPLEMVRDAMLRARASEHDQLELHELSQGISRWRVHHKAALAELDADEYRKLVAALTPEALVENAFYEPYDGLRSAHDPELAERFDAAQRGREYRIGRDKPADLSEAGFAWYGLMPARWPAPELDEDGEPRREYWYEGDVRGWVVAATREPWQAGGRLVLMEWERDLRVRWMHEDDFKALRTANGRGEFKIAEHDRPTPQPPEWVQWRDLRRQGQHLSDLREHLQMLVEDARREGREFKPDFNGGTIEEFMKLLGAELRGEYSFNIANLRIWTSDEGVFVRETSGRLWAEATPKGVRLSWREQ